MVHRQTGIDLVKVLAMVLITATHYIGYSGVLENQELLLSNRIIFAGIFVLSRAALNLFAISTGYLMYMKAFSCKRIFRIWFDVVFVSFAGLLVAVVFFEIPSIGILLKSILPVSTFSYWYINTHFSLLCIAPLLNMLIEKVSAQTHLKICCTLTVVLCVFFTSNPFANPMVYVGHGRGIVWFSALYLWGGCLARREITFPKYIAMMASIGMVCVLTVLELLKNKLPWITRFNMFEVNSLAMFIIALSMFVLLKDISFESEIKKKTLCILSESSLFVYLIQEHNALRDIFWSLFRTTELADSFWIWIDFWVAMICLWPCAWLIRKMTVRIWPIFMRNVKPLLDKINKQFGCTVEE